MVKRYISVFIIIIFSISTFGCATIPEEHKGAGTVAGIGAATGAIAGALLGKSGSKTEMFLLGGLLGALAGAAIGHYAVDQKRTAQQTAQTYNYQTSQGIMARIENATATPSVLAPGQKVDMNLSYAVLGAGAGKEIEVIETREIRYNGELVGKPEAKSLRQDGTYTSTVPLMLAANSAKGKYIVLMTIKAGNVSDSRETSFTVN